MKSILTICMIFLTVFGNFYGQCNCPSLPTPGKSVLVNTVTELQNALTLANSNNGNMTILLAKGNYNLNSNLLYISSNMKNLTIRGQTGNRDDVVIKGLGFNGGVTHIFNVAAAHFTVADMTIGWVYYHPIQIHGESNADSALIHNVKIIDGNEQFIKISGSSTEPNVCDGGIIECCELEFSSGIGNQYYTGGIDGHHCANWIIRYNTFKHLRSPDGNLAEHAIHFWSNSSDILVENNFIMDCDRGIGFGLSDDPSRGNFGGMIRNNIVHTSRDVGIGIERTPDVKIYNNTVWTENYFNSIEYRFTGSTNIQIANNLTNQAIALREGAQGILTSNYTKATSGLFTDAANFNFHLAKKNINLIAAGKVLNDVIKDMDCLPRGITNDIGADQFEVITRDIQVDTKTNNVQVYPNPALDFITIVIKDPVTPDLKFEISNQLGQIRWQQKISSQSTRINLKDIETGIYCLRITSPTNLYKSQISLVKL